MYFPRSHFSTQKAKGLPQNQTWTTWYEPTVLTAKPLCCSVWVCVCTWGSLLRDATPPPPRELRSRKFRPQTPGNSYLYKINAHLCICMDHIRLVFSVIHCEFRGGGYFHPEYTHTLAYSNIFNTLFPFENNSFVCLGCLTHWILLLPYPMLCRFCFLLPGYWGQLRAVFRYQVLKVLLHHIRSQ